MPTAAPDRLRRIESRQNALIKDLRAAFGRGELTSDGYCAIEGVRIVEEAIRSGLRFKSVLFNESGRELANRLLPQLAAQVETLITPDGVFESAVPTEAPQGVAALVKLKSSTLEELLKFPRPLIVVAAGLQDPGNLGTIIRSSEAFGATGLVIGEKTVSHLNAKTVRASAGSVFRLGIAKASLDDAIAQMEDKGLRLVATSSHKGEKLSEADLAGPLALFIGNEGAGVPREVLSKMDTLVTIPHSTKVESLNAGIAASVLLYEIARQRGAGERV